MTDETLLSRPFCGRAAEVLDKHIRLPMSTDDKSTWDVMYRVQCVLRECSCRTNWWYPMRAAVQSWNRRVKDA